MAPRMMKLDQRLHVADPLTGKGARILVVGPLDGDGIAGAGAGRCPDDGGAAPVCLRFDQVNADTLARLRPQVVVSALFTAQFDCLDLATRLDGVGYRGRYRAIARTVPDPGLVRREISEICPGLDFDLVILDAGDAA